MDEKDRRLAFDVIHISRRRMEQIEDELLSDKCLNFRELVKELILIANTMLRVGMLLSSDAWKDLDLYEGENDAPLV